MHLRRQLLPFAALLCTTMLFAQDRQPPAAPGGAATTAGSPAEQACKNLLAALREGEGAALWDFLPRSYQDDVNLLVRSLAEKVDPRLYEQAFAVLQRTGKVLAGKKQFVLGNRMVQQMVTGQDQGQIDSGYDQLVAMLNALGNSDLARHQALGKFDGRKFCAAGGSTLLRQLLTTQTQDGMTGAEILAGMQITTLQQQGNRTLLQFAAPGQRPSKEEYLQVEGRWLPLDLVRKWPTVMKQAKGSIATMPAGGDKERQAQIRMALGMAESVLKQFEDAETQAEFDEALSGLQGLTGRGAGVSAQRRR